MNRFRLYSLSQKGLFTKDGVVGFEQVALNGNLGVIAKRSKS